MHILYLYTVLRIGLYRIECWKFWSGLPQVWILVPPLAMAAPKIKSTALSFTHKCRVLLASNISARSSPLGRSSLITYCRSCSDLPRHPCFCRTSWAPVGKHTSTLSRPTPREGAYTLLLLSRFTCLCRTAVPSLYLCLLRISLGTATVLSSLFWLALVGGALGQQGGDLHVEGALHDPEGHALLDRPWEWHAQHCKYLSTILRLLMMFDQMPWWLNCFTCVESCVGYRTL